MKSVYLRSGLTLLCAAILSACGGSDGSLQLSGTISGLGARTGLTLVNNGNGEELVINKDTTQTSFVFTRLVAVDEYFDVQPKIAANAGFSCVASNNQGKANVYNAYYVVVTCTPDPRKLGGTVSGLTGSGLVLANGSATVPVSANGAFALPTIGDGSVYGVTVLTQPAGQTCTVANGVGTAGKTDVTNVTVTCSNNGSQT